MTTFTAENRAVLMRELQECEHLTDIVGRALPAIVRHLLEAHDTLLRNAQEVYATGLADGLEKGRQVAERQLVAVELQAQERVDFIRATAQALFTGLHHTYHADWERQRACWRHAADMWARKPEDC